MKTLNAGRSLVIVSLCTLFTACGGGSSTPDTGTSPPNGDAPPPVDAAATKFAIGPIASFGSIVVGGVRYETDDARFDVDDGSGTENDLAVGHVVRIRATAGDDGIARALEVRFDANVEGPVESIDALANRMVVLGQTVTVGSDTSFDDDIAPPSLDGLAVGGVVEVSGLPDADGVIAATRIERKPPGSLFEVHGIVGNIDAAGLRFTLGTLTVDYNGAALADFPGGQISNGDPVEVKGGTFGPGGELLATRVEYDAMLEDGEPGDLLELEGFISRFASPQDFDVAGIAVRTSESTTFEGGNTIDLGLNIKVEVEGVLNEDGTLLASKVDIRRARAVRATAGVDSVDATSGSLVLLGIRVTVDALTRLEDKSDLEVSPLTLLDLNVGDYVEVRGDEFPAGSGQLRGTLLERDDPDEQSLLQGFVESVSEPRLTILGVTIETGGATEFRDENDLPLSPAAFFARVTVNTLVKAKGIESSATVITADEVQLQLED